MYLSRLEIFGFKSFAKKTRVEFHGGTTGIVGPNGCGKSNIVDAIRWVLGEQKAGLLRSDNMQNVIFNGTRTHKPLGMAEVSITIENTHGVLPIEYTEVTITRRLFRSGESQYLLNNVNCRLKDILDLFMDTGVGPNAYSVIELSMVEKILNGRPEERRQIFEEAAGVTKYKLRRKAAFRKLEATEQDLVRLSDIISEVEKTTNALRRQVHKAKRYQQFTDELRQLEMDYSAYHLKMIEEELGPLEESSREKGSTRDQVSGEVASAEVFIEKHQLELLEIERQLNARRQDLNANVQRIQQKEEEILVSQERLKAAENAKTRAAREIEDLQARQKSLAEEKVENARALASVAEETDKMQEKLDGAQKALGAIKKQYEEKRASGQEYEQARLRTLEEIAAVQRRLDQSQTAIAYDQKQIEALAASEGKNQQICRECEQRIEELQQQRRGLHEELETAVERLAVVKREISTLRDAITGGKEEVLRLQAQIRSRHERMDLLRKFAESYEDYPEGVRHVLSEHVLAEGCFGTISDLITVEEAYRRAIEAALGEAAVAVVVDGDERALQAMQALQRDKKGIATFISLSHHSAAGKTPPPLPGGQGVVGPAIAFVRTEEKYMSSLERLLSGMLIVEDIDVALRLASSREAEDLTLVTLAGEVVHVWGALRGGDPGDTEASLVGRRAIIAELETKINKLQQELAEAEARLSANENKMHELNSAHEAAELAKSRLADSVQKVELALGETGVNLARAKERVESLAEEMRILQQRMADNQTKIEELRPALASALASQKGVEDEFNEFRKALLQLEDAVKVEEEKTQEIHLVYVGLASDLKNLQQTQERLERTDREIEQAISRRKEEIIAAANQMEDLQARIEELRELLQDDFAERKELEEVIGEVEKQVQERRQEIEAREKSLRKVRQDRDALAEDLHRIELRIAELKMKKNNLIQHIREVYEARLEEHPAPEVIEPSEAATRINDLKQKLRTMGPVNLLALKDYETEKERLDFLMGQKNDLLQAEDNLKETIRVINATAYERFNNVYSSVRENFIQVFKGFFENGNADLRLDGDDPLEAEIVIEASPKGRKLESLALLSGGEKALTAISLLFALYLVKPSPFCILDEVDAPLDDANVKRFTGALEKFSDRTQFIVVTHNKLTMNAARQLYGITMEEPGISKVVSVKFGEFNGASQQQTATATN